MGQTRKSGDAISTSALPPTADIPESGCDVRKVPRNGHLAAPSLRPPPNEASRRSCGVTAVASLDQLLYDALPQNREGKQVATIAEWLASLGMSEYAQRFAENDIDTSVLRHLTDQDLKELGISVGHRRKMLAAIVELAAAPSATAFHPERRDDVERRQITIMFRDLVGSTALSTRLDPEDLQEITVPITDVAPKSSPNPMASSRDTWATVCSPISAIRRPMKTMPSRQCARGWRWSKRWRSSCEVVDERCPAPFGTDAVAGRKLSSSAANCCQAGSLSIRRDCGSRGARSEHLE
jgi:hypothetical protein